MLLQKENILIPSLQVIIEKLTRKEFNTRMNLGVVKAGCIVLLLNRLLLVLNKNERSVENILLKCNTISFKKM